MRNNRIEMAAVLGLSRTSILAATTAKRLNLAAISWI
jgi:hypothetical protein